MIRQWRIWLQLETWRKSLYFDFDGRTIEEIMQKWIEFTPTQRNTRKCKWRCTVTWKNECHYYRLTIFVCFTDDCLNGWNTRITLVLYSEQAWSFTNSETKKIPSVSTDRICHLIGRTRIFRFAGSIEIRIIRSWWLRCLDKKKWNEVWNQHISMNHQWYKQIRWISKINEQLWSNTIIWIEIRYWAETIQ
jgi:hypothetical protein